MDQNNIPPSSSISSQRDGAYNPEIQKFYQRFLASHPQLVERVNSQKFVFYVYVILTLLVVSFFGVIVIRPTVLTIFELREEHADNAEVIGQLDDKLAALSSLKSQQSQLSTQLALLDRVIPTEPEIPTLVRKIETLAFQNSVAISRIEVGAIEVYPNATSDSPFFSFNFTMNVRGGTQSLNAFLSELIHFDRLITIDRVSGGGVSEVEAEYIIVARAYFYNPINE